jgi:hypothetical protein
MSVVGEQVDDAARVKARRRALDIEAGLAWTALFGSLPTQYSWNATKARRAGAEAFGRDQLGFTSRLDGRWHPWPSPQRISKDFAGEHAGLRGMDCYRRIMTNVRKKLRDLGTSYKPIVRSDVLARAQLQARARHISGQQPMTVPHELQCASLRQHSFEREIPWLSGSNTTGPIRVPAVRDRGVCVMSSMDSTERASFFAHALRIDMFDRSIGLMIAASTTQVQIGSPKGSVPGLADLAASTSSQHRSGDQCLEILEASAADAESGNDAGRCAEGRRGLLATLEWALRHQPDLVQLGPLSLAIAEGQSLLSKLVAFVDGWTAGPAAAAITLDPTGSHDEAMLMARATWTFEATQAIAPDPETVVDPAHDMTAAEAKILRRIIEAS